MARNEADREDLLAEATALVERIELWLDNEHPSVVVGFRATGAASLYFGADPAYHFNADGELRRAYLAGRLLKAEEGRLVSLLRERVPGEVRLLRHALDAAETQSLLDDLTRQLQLLHEAIAQPTTRVLGQVPETVDVHSRVTEWLERALGAGTPRIAARPNV